MFSFIFVITTGLVAGGLVSSLWATVAGEPLRPGELAARDIYTPLRVAALVLSLPIILGDLAIFCWRETGRGRLYGGIAIGGAVVWCFVQGVVIVSGLRTVAHMMS